MKSVNVFVRAEGDDLLRIEEEYAFLGRQTIRVEGGLSVLALPLRKPKKKKVEPRKSRQNDEDASKAEKSREQKPKRS